MADILQKRFEVRCSPITQVSISLLELAVFFAEQASDVQAAFFNEFDVQLRRMCEIRKGSLGVSMQCHWINKELTPAAKYTLLDISTDHSD